MADPSVIFEGVRWADAEVDNPASPYGGDWVDSAGTAPAEEPDMVYQGSGSISEKIKASELGVGWIPDAAVDMQTIKRVLLLKTLVTTVGILATTPATGAIAEVGSGGRRSAYYRYYIYDGTSWPPNTSWLVIPIDPNVGGHADETPGSAPTVTAINWTAFVATMSVATAKSENLAMDALDWVTHGKGLKVNSGDGASDDCTFQDFADYDQGTVANRYGLCTTRDGVFFIVGMLTIGDATETDFTDENQVLVFPDGRFDTGFAGIRLGLQNTNSVLNITACTFIGVGSKGADGASADTRPVLEITGTSGAATLDACGFQRFDYFDLTAGGTFQNCVFTNVASIVQNGAFFDACTFDGPSVDVSVALIDSDQPSIISNCAFNSLGTGHAIQLLNTGEFNFSGNLFNNYALQSGDPGNRALFNNSGGAITINIVGGGGIPTYRNGSGATTSIVSPKVLTFTGLPAATEVTIVRLSDSWVMHHTESTPSTTDSFNYAASAIGTVVDVLFMNLDYDPHVGDIDSYTLPNEDTSIPISMILDRTYWNP